MIVTEEWKRSQTDRAIFHPASICTFFARHLFSFSLVLLQEWRVRNKKRDDRNGWDPFSASKKDPLLEYRKKEEEDGHKKEGRVDDDDVILH